MRKVGRKTRGSEIKRNGERENPAANFSKDSPGTSRIFRVQACAREDAINEIKVDENSPSYLQIMFMVTVVDSGADKLLLVAWQV